MAEGIGVDEDFVGLVAGGNSFDAAANGGRRAGDKASADRQQFGRERLAAQEFFGPLNGRNGDGSAAKQHQQRHALTQGQAEGFGIGLRADG